MSDPLPRTAGGPMSGEGPADTMLEHGFIVLADLSGFTTFVTATEIRHGANVVAALLDTVMRRLSPPLDVEEIEGDAIFAVGREKSPAAALPIVRLVEDAYVAFRERRGQIRLSTRCTCQACRSIEDLDLKVVVHHGEFVAQRVGGRDKPTGPAVILAHRLLKLPAPGTRAWLLLTSPAYDRAHLDADDPEFQRRRLDCGPLGVIDVRLSRLEPAWHRYLDAQTSVDPASALCVLEYRLPARPEILWNWLTLPELRRQYEPAATAIGRTADGDPRSMAVRCDHGAFEVLETVRTWRPHHSCTRDTVIHPFRIPLRATWTLAEDADTTHLTIAVNAVPGAGWLSRLAARLAAPVLRRSIERAMASLARLLVEQYA